VLGVAMNGTGDVAALVAADGVVRLFQVRVMCGVRACAECGVAGQDGRAAACAKRRRGRACARDRLQPRVSMRVVVYALCVTCCVRTQWQRDRNGVRSVRGVCLVDGGRRARATQA
jgi:hypothetical protein